MWESRAGCDVNPLTDEEAGMAHFGWHVGNGVGAWRTVSSSRESFLVCVFVQFSREKTSCFSPWPLV